MIVLLVLQVLQDLQVLSSFIRASVFYPGPTSPAGLPGPPIVSRLEWVNLLNLQVLQVKFFLDSSKFLLGILIEIQVRKATESN